MNKTCDTPCLLGTIKVSIPYERESTCEPVYGQCVATGEDLVSIPYERESTCELVKDPHRNRSRCRVSIPYERESTCEQTSTAQTHTTHTL